MNMQFFVIRILYACLLHFLKESKENKGNKRRFNQPFLLLYKLAANFIMTLLYKIMHLSNL